MAFENILVDRVGSVAIVTLNRPRVLNAVSHSLLAELYAAMQEFDQDDAIRAVILTGAGERAFSAGADIHETADRSPEQAKQSSDLWSTWNWYLATYRKPTIGAINGLVYGGAAQLAAMLDIRIGCERSSFRFLYAALGRIVGTWVLPSIVGWARAKELLMTARVVEADEAYRIGLLSQLVSSDQLMPTALAMGELIAKNHPESVQGIKALLREQIGMGYEEMYNHEREAVRTRFPAVPFEDAFQDFLSRKGRGE